MTCCVVCARALDEKAESIVDSHDGTNQIQHSHWYKGASHEWESLIPTICANVSLLRSKPAIPVWKLRICTTWFGVLLGDSSGVSAKRAVSDQTSTQSHVVQLGNFHTGMAGF